MAMSDMRAWTRDRWGISLITFMLLVIPLNAQQPEGQIQGQVLDGDGRPVSGARVIAYPVDLPPPARSIQSVSQQEGAFLLDRLGAGTHRADLLNPCHSDTSIGRVSLRPAEQRSGVQVTLKKGLTLQVRMDDPKKLLPVYEKLGGGRYLMVGISTATSVFQPARVAGTDAQGRIYSLTIPVDTPLKLRVSGPKILITDEAGQPVREGDPPVAFQVSATDTEKTFRFRIDALQN